MLLIGFRKGRRRWDLHFNRSKLWLSQWSQVLDCSILRAFCYTSPLNCTKKVEKKHIFLRGTGSKTLFFGWASHPCLSTYSEIVGLSWYHHWQGKPQFASLVGGLRPLSNLEKYTLKSDKWSIQGLGMDMNGLRCMEIQKWGLKHQTANHQLPPFSTESKGVRLSLNLGWCNHSILRRGMLLYESRVS